MEWSSCFFGCCLLQKNVIPNLKEYQYEQKLQKKKELSDLNSSNSENAVSQYYAKIRKQKAQKEADEKMRTEIDEMVKLMDRQMLEDTISDWNRKPEFSRYMDYLKFKRQTIK